MSLSPSIYQLITEVAMDRLISSKQNVKFKHIYFTSIENKFLQLILISLDSASWELHQYLCRMCGPMKIPKVETRSRDSNLVPHDCKADALPLTKMLVHVV